MVSLQGTNTKDADLYSDVNKMQALSNFLTLLN